MNVANKKILSRLTKVEDEPRKALSIPFKLENIKNLDAIAKAMTRHSGATTTRNMLIEDAIEGFIEEAIIVFNEKGIELDIDDRNDYDTVVLPAQMIDEYMQAFFNDHEWRYARISKDRIPKIKYIALYVGAPQSAVCHYAKVAPNGFIYVESEGKYKILLEGDPVELPNPIPLGTTSPMAVRSPKYTTLQKLFTASEFRELYIRD